jgi:hypothetical protein
MSEKDLTYSRENLPSTNAMSYFTETANKKLLFSPQVGTLLVNSSLVHSCCYGHLKLIQRLLTENITKLDFEKNKLSYSFM